MNQIFEDIMKKLEKELDEKRYQHTIGVTYTAASLAMRYGENMQAAILAGLLHDCANEKSANCCIKRRIC